LTKIFKHDFHFYLFNFMKRIFYILPIVAAAFIGVGFQEFFDPAPKFEVPEGFVVEEVANNATVGSVVAITFDNQGRMVVAKEFGEIVTMVPNADGVLEQRVLTGEIVNSQGIVFDGPDLIVMGVGPEGTALYRVTDADGDAKGEKVELIESSNRRIEDHGPHAPVWGPDGFLYWINANTAGIYSDIAPLSPVRKYGEGNLFEGGAGFGGGFYKTPEGKVYRNEVARYNGTASNDATRVNYSDWELFAMGLRNPYDCSFNLIGELFTYDSDHEPDLEQPWYRSTRTNQILPGGEYGYREGSAVHPDYYYDDAPLLEDQKRGSPTGVLTYLSYNYPKEYWDMPMFADWSRGRVIASKLARNGAAYTPQSSNFISGSPLNVCDIEVGPDGNIYFVLGGRYSEGGIYRVVYKGANAMARPVVKTKIDEVLTLIQPRSAFSRQKTTEIKKSMGDAAWLKGLKAVVQDTKADAEKRVRAMELLRVFGPLLDEVTLKTLAGDAAWEIRATAAYDLGMRTTDNARVILTGLLHDADPFVQRRAAEGLMRTGLHPGLKSPVRPVEDVFPLLASKDASVRFAGRILLRTTNPNQWREAALKLTEYPQVTQAVLAYVQTVGDQQDMYNYARILNRELELLKAKPTDAQLLELLRMIQVTMTKDKGVRSFPVVESSSRVKGGVIYKPGRGFYNSELENQPAGQRPAGGAPQGGGNNTVYGQMGNLLLERFPTTDWRLNKEIVRVFAYMQTPGAQEKIMTAINTEADRKQQMHYVDMVSRFNTGWTDQNIEQLTAWYVDAAKGGPGRGGNVTAFRAEFVSHLTDEQAKAVTAKVQAAMPQGAVAGGRGGAGGGGGGGFGGGGGRPGGPMTEEAVDALIYNPQTAMGGNAAAGIKAFEKGACITCHTFGPVGTAYGPDLTTAGSRFSRKDMITAIVYPSRLINDQYEGTTVTTTKGGAFTGKLVLENGQGITLQFAGGAEIMIPAAEIKTKEAAKASLMPEGLMNGLSTQERNDLLALLAQGVSAIPDSTLRRINKK
jgi:putative heme-binding domain-containing protein